MLKIKAAKHTSKNIVKRNEASKSTAIQQATKPHTQTNLLQIFCPSLLARRDHGRVHGRDHGRFPWCDCDPYGTPGNKKWVNNIAKGKVLALH